MNKIFKFSFSLLLAIVLTVTPAAGVVYHPNTVYAATQPKASVTNVNLYVGYKSYQIKFKNLDSKASVDYKSSNAKTAKVSSSGVITPVSTGNATVTVTMQQNGKKYTSKIKVAVSNSTIKFTSKKADLQIGDTYTYKAAVYGTKGKVTWSVSKKKVAKIDRKTGKLKALAKGEVDVIATAGSISSTYTVTISEGKFSTENKNITCYDEQIIYIDTKNMDDDENIVYKVKNEDVVSCQWGYFDGDRIPLLISPQKVGKTSITISSSKTADKLVLNVTVTKEPEIRDKNAKKLSAKEIYKKCAPATAEVQAETAEGSVIGSGFFVYSGWLVTNYHVIEGATKIQVVTYDKKTYDVDTIIAYDEKYDIAVLSIDEVTPHLTMNKGDISVGEKVYALGSPRGLTGSLSDGIVSSASRISDGVDYVQITAPISPGNSGGPLLNEYGEVIGINTFMLLDSQNLNFAVNVYQVNKLNFNASMSADDFYKLSEEAEPTYVKEDTAKSEKLETAQDLNSNTFLSGYLAVNNNADFYHVKLEEAGTVGAMLVLPESKDFSNVNIEILDKDSKVVASSTVEDYDGTNYHVVVGDLSAGDYYIRVFSSETNNSAERDYSVYVAFNNLSDY